jgi:nicotinamide-nucleotide amidase
MKAAVVGVGDELLSGVVVNTNAAMCGELLLAAGIPVVRSVCVGDVEDEIVDVLRQACAHADVVVVTGGLGPTQDDRTREALATLLGSRLVRDPAVVQAIRERFRAFGREMPESNAKQGDVPHGASAIPNPWGTAPGIRAEVSGAVVYAIPGVPGEARRMLTEQVLPELGEGTGRGTIRTLQVRCVGLPESELADRLADLATADNPRMAFLPGGGEIRLRFVATGDDAQALLDRASAVVAERCGEVVYGTEDQSLEEVVVRRLLDRRLTVATAESCTAGLLSARLASVPGVSATLRGGIVCYQDDIKESQLGIPAELLASEGSVSEAVAREMAAGARRVIGSDVAVSVTCAAGPDPLEWAEPGTTFIALAGPEDGRVEARGLRLPGDREQVRLFATTFALDLLRRSI